MGRGLTVATARVRCASRAFRAPPGTPALTTAARGAPLGLAGVDSAIVMIVIIVAIVIVVVVMITATVRVAGRLVRRRVPRVRLGLLRVRFRRIRLGLGLGLVGRGRIRA
ncbi:hypothetical protein [Streptomyces sp. ME18-1-4]|uniref:hypothetical protein n=1 Tax=Streptomyces sp. ME18-1-4 TaxID=3028685 RepID=UPI0029C9BA0E|nr:hypothetical protein [Streptomyces sp. ME18-1-4]